MSGSRDGALGNLLPEFADEPRCAFTHQRVRVLLVECLLARAQRLLVKGQLNNASDDCERTLRIDPADENALRLMLETCRRLGRPRDALPFFQQAQRRALLSAHANTHARNFESRFRPTSGRAQNS